MSIHTEPVSSAEQHIPPAAIGQRVILPGVSWATYERLLADFQDSHTAHFTYDRGVLEIMVLSAKHENLNRTLSLLVEVIAEELEIDIARFGRTIHGVYARPAAIPSTPSHWICRTGPGCAYGTTIRA